MAQRPVGIRHREAEAPPPLAWSCAPPPEGCPPLRLDREHCVEADGLLHPEVAQGVVVDARLDHERLAELALPDGGYWARVPDPDGGCASLVVTFSTDEAALAGVEAARHPGADDVAIDVQGPRVDDVFVVPGGAL